MGAVRLKEVMRSVCRYSSLHCVGISWGMLQDFPFNLTSIAAWVPGYGLGQWRREIIETESNCSTDSRLCLVGGEREAAS